MYKEKKIGIVVLNYNDAETTKKLILNIRDFKVIDQIVVVDNLSTDNSYEELKNVQTDRISVIQTDKNGGYSYGNNYGIRFLLDKIYVDVVIVANPDVIFDDAFIMRAVDDLIVEDVDAVTGKMLDTSNRFVPNCLKIDTYCEDLINCTLLIKKMSAKKKIHLMENGLSYTNSLPGSLFAITGVAYKAINGFDDNVFLYCEERILGKRFLNAGFKMGIDTRVSFVHNHSVSISKSINKLRRTKIMFDSLLYYYDTYEDIGKLKRLILYLATRYGLFIRLLAYTIDDWLHQV